MAWWVDLRHVNFLDVSFHGSCNMQATVLDPRSQDLSLGEAQGSGRDATRKWNSVRSRHTAPSAARWPPFPATGCTAHWGPELGEVSALSPPRLVNHTPNYDLRFFREEWLSALEEMNHADIIIVLFCFSPTSPWHYKLILKLLTEEIWTLQTQYNFMIYF